MFNDDAFASFFFAPPFITGSPRVAGTSSLLIT
jgi:hypothetical protein